MDQLICDEDLLNEILLKRLDDFLSNWFDQIKDFFEETNADHDFDFVGYIDASPIYGSSLKDSKKFRNGNTGFLRMSTFNGMQGTYIY